MGYNKNSEKNDYRELAVHIYTILCKATSRTSSVNGKCPFPGGELKKKKKRESKKKRED